MPAPKPPVFLRDLAERLRHVPVDYDIDDGDIDELIGIARSFENPDIRPLELGEIIIENLQAASEKNPTDILHGTAYVLGMPMHFRFIRVEEADEYGRLITSDPDVSSELDCLYELSGADKPLATVRIPGYDGSYILCSYPHTR
jgi:hypothetical protein